MSIYNTTQKTLGRTHPVMVAADDKDEYSPPKKGIESERNLSLTLSSIHTEISLATHEIFHPEKSLRNQDMVRWDRHSVTLTNLGEYMISYISLIP